MHNQVQQSTIDGDGSETGNENPNEGADSHLDHLSEISKGPVILHSTASPLGNWVCAKRSDIHKKRKNKNPYKITQSLASIIDDSPSTSSQNPKYLNSKFSNSTLRLKLPRSLVRNGRNIHKALSENVFTNACFDKNPSAQPQNTPSLFGTFRKQRSMLKFGKRGGQNPASSQLYHESTEVPVGETIRESKRSKLTHNEEHHNEFAPELDQIGENTEVQDGTSLHEDTQFEIETADLEDHFTEYVDTPNDEPINLENASWYHEEAVVAGRVSGYGNDNKDAPADDDGDEGCDDDDIGDGVDVDDEDDDDTAIGTTDDTSHDTPQDDSSITSNREDEMNLERSLANFQELSGSPSTASTMSRSTFNEPVSKPLCSFAQPLDSDLPVQVAERPKGIEEGMDKPCVCSCRESLPKESHNALSNTKERQLPPLYIGPRETGPFSAYRSFTRPDPLVSSGFESPSQSFSTLSHNLVPPSPSNPVLRLMGKNLLVVNHEEITAPPTPSSHSPSGFGLPSYGVNQNFSYQKFGSVISQSQPATNLYQPFHVSDSQRPVSPSYVPKEVIVMDGSPKIDNMPVPLSVPMQLQSVVGPENSAPQNISMLGASMLQPKPFFCFPPQNQVGPTGPILYPRVGTGFIAQHVGPSGSHEQGTFVPGSFMFQSPSNQVGNALYYSHTMR